MNKKQSGFTIIEVLLCIIAVTLFVGVGIYGYNSIKDKNDTKNNVHNKTTKAKNKSIEKEYFEIPELSIKVVLPSDLKDISYTTEQISYDTPTPSGSKTTTGVYISSKKLNDLCGGAQGAEAPIALLTKEKGDYNTAAQASEEAVVTEYSPGELFKQFDTFFIDGISGKGNGGYAGCEDANTVAEESVKLFNSLKTTFRSAKQL